MEPAKVTVAPISAPLLRLIREAVGRALNAREGDEPFPPFSIWDSKSSPGSIVAYATITMDEVIATARLLFVQTTPDYYVFARDGFLTEPEAGIYRTEIVDIEAYEKGMGHGLRITQRFVAQGEHGKPQVISNLRYMGNLPWPTMEEYAPIVARFDAERAATPTDE